MDLRVVFGIYQIPNWGGGRGGGGKREYEKWVSSSSGSNALFNHCYLSNPPSIHLFPLTLLLHKRLLLVDGDETFAQGIIDSTSIIIKHLVVVIVVAIVVAAAANHGLR